LLFLLLFAATAVITWQFVRRQSDPDLSYIVPAPVPASTPAAQAGSLHEDPFMSSFAAHGETRPVYPYSVIPGGVHSVAELKHDIEKDPTVARQYRDFDFQHARLLQVSQKQAMYVSYRIGQKVYWTRKKIALHPGETLISDGRMTVRARCGNRVASAPLDPGSPLEPPEADFNQPYAAMIAVPNASPALTASPATLPATVAKKRKWWFLPLFAAPLGGLADPGGSSLTHDPLAVTPEPGTTLLLVSGMAGVYWRVRKYRKKN
jgi:hypothetical protein